MNNDKQADIQDQILAIKQGLGQVSQVIRFAEKDLIRLEEMLKDI